MQTESHFRAFAAGALSMMVVAVIAIRTGAEYKQFQEVKQLRAECEQFLPRNEHCKIVLMPTSKD